MHCLCCPALQCISAIIPVSSIFIKSVFYLINFIVITNNEQNYKTSATNDLTFKCFNFGHSFSSSVLFLYFTFLYFDPPRLIKTIILDGQWVSIYNHTFKFIFFYIVSFLTFNVHLLKELFDFHGKYCRVSGKVWSG
jgi:hypothetical protein